MASWKNKCRNTNACRRQQQITWHHDLQGKLCCKGLVWLGVHSQPGWKDSTWRQWSNSHDFQSNSGGRSNHIWKTVAILPVWCTDYTCHHSHRLSEPPAKGRIWNGLPQLAHNHSHSLDFCGFTALGIPEWVGMNGHIEWQAGITSGLQLGSA